MKLQYSKTTPNHKARQCMGRGIIIDCNHIVRLASLSPVNDLDKEKHPDGHVSKQETDVVLWDRQGSLALACTCRFGQFIVGEVNRNISSYNTFVGVLDQYCYSNSGKTFSSPIVLSLRKYKESSKMKVSS